MFKIEQKRPYSIDYNECIAQAKKDQIQNTRPELKDLPDMIDGYDVIYLGYPNYWSSMPMVYLLVLRVLTLAAR